MEITPIGYIENDYGSKFAVPRQSNIATSIMSTIRFYEDYAKAEAVKDIEDFSHLWIVWEFDKNGMKSTSLTVRPPRLGGNKRVGVFASRSPFRPNPIGLSSVKLERVEYDDRSHPSLIVSGADLMSGTPIYDIKPYIKLSDCHPDAKCGYVDEEPFNILKVEYSQSVASAFPREKLNLLCEILENDPRPAYQHEGGRIYGFTFAGKEVRFRVDNNVLTILEVNNGR